ncbi:MAG: TraR/DksA C4-type zinc finger protein [Candidatus Berkelbacteria bacterium]|nr:TraR/DksA C4-type zinc finger protein [Candidatus Berkelbacteria bacterium]
MKLSQKFLEQQQSALQDEKKRITAEIKKLKKYPDYGETSDDNAQELTEFENNQPLEDQLEQILKKVNLSLLAIENGTYGVCSKCQGMIETGRLEIIPYADLCVTCQQKNK